MKRFDRDGRDVTDLPGLWDESDTLMEDVAKTYTPEMHVANLVQLVGRLVHQVRRFDLENGTVDRAMDYLRRSDLLPSITRGVAEFGGNPRSTADLVAENKMLRKVLCQIPAEVVMAAKEKAGCPTIITTD